jgi:hypothetical protein
VVLILAALHPVCALLQHVADSVSVRAVTEGRGARGVVLAVDGRGAGRTAQTILLLGRPGMAGQED